MDGKPWEIAWRELCWEGAACFSNDRVDGREAVGSSLGRAPLGARDTEATTGWQTGNRGSGGRERHFSDDMVDGRETVGNSFGREGATRKRLQGGQTGKAWEIASAELRISVNGQVGK